MIGVDYMNTRTRIKIIKLEEKQNKNQKLFNSLGINVKLISINSLNDITNKNFKEIVKNGD